MTTTHHGRSTPAGQRAKTARPRKPGKIQPILVDRLAQALAAHGVSLKRTAILGVAAAAFGYHNANEFAAAGSPHRGPDPRPREPAERRDLVVVYDPLAHAPTASTRDSSSTESASAAPSSSASRPTGTSWISRNCPTRP